MKKALLLILVFTICRHCAAATPRVELWRQAEAAMTNGLPKTAITNLESILAGALSDHAYPEAAKAVALKVSLQAGTDSDPAAGKIVRLAAALAGSPAPMHPILHTILADWYWSYFETHRWQFAQRTTTASKPGADFTTWDSPALFDEIGRQFQLALADNSSLKSIPIASWGELLEKGTMPDSARPTLYDFIVHEAVSFFYAESERPGKPESAFEISANDPAFDSVERFLMWQPQTADTNSPMLKAVHLFQDLLRFHQNDPPPAPAFAQADLDRLVWAWNVASGENKDIRCTNALEIFIKRHTGEEISSDARDREAGILYQKQDYLPAHRIAEEGEKQFPNSPGGKLCHNLLLEIEDKSASISTERIWNAPWPKISVRYRNIDSLEFRAIPVNWEIFLDRHHHRPEDLSDAERKKILRKKSALKWSAKLPTVTDYKETNFDLSAPESLKPGFYFIAARHKSNRGENSDISLTPIWVSDLAFVLRQNGSNLDGFVTEANSGEPIAGAEISVWHLDNSTGNRIADPGLVTDTNGFFSMPSKEGLSYLFRVRARGEEIATAQDEYGYSSGQQTAQNIAFFYTDRAIYRPGQTIQYKGICFHVDPVAGSCELVTGKNVTVTFRDTNGKEIERQKHVANDYGSFTGSFVAPRSSLTGAMELRAEGAILGTTTIRVEEYKRPRFEVKLDAPRSAPKLNELVRLTGHAMSYTGAPIDGARISYRIVRDAHMPNWWNWGPVQQSQEIAHGNTKTVADGSFEIEFTAAPDLSLSETNNPLFAFTINADVTDNAGETRSGEQVVQIGYTALQLEPSADEWQTIHHPVEIKIETKSFDNQPQAAKGKIKIYALRSPGKVERPTLDSQSHDLIHWPLANVVSEKRFSTGTNGETTISAVLPEGAYRAILESKDRFGRPVTAQLPVQVFDPTATKLSLKIPHVLIAPKWEAQPGDEFMALWGTGYPEGRACIEIERRGKLIERYWTQPGRTQQQISIPVTEAMRGGFTLNVTQIRENRAYFDSRTVEVPWKNKELTIKWEHFISKLQPGQKESWTAVITGPKAERAVAEMVATLYDESLDAFTPLEWNRLNVFGEDESSIQSTFANNLQSLDLDFSHWAPKALEVSEHFRHFPWVIVDRSWGNIDQTYGGEVYSLHAVGYINVNAASAGIPTITPAAASPPSLTPIAGRELSPEPMAGGTPREKQKIDLDRLSVRKNLNETAFFFPKLLSDSNGVVRLTFTMPEALTKWHFLALAHDKSLRSGFLEAHAVTSKDLMVQPNPPRFLREDDTVEFTVKVSNQSNRRQAGSVRLTLAYALNDKSADADLGNTNAEQSFEIPARESRGFSWRIHVPDGCGFLTYKAVAATDKLSDGEEGAIPVLSRRILITESLPLAIRGPATNHFRFEKLLASGASPTLRNESLTVQMVSNPAWYAVLALPYLMEFPHECNEQMFNRLYANALARHIAQSDPKIRRIFDLWKTTPALDSPLEKNQELKSVMLEETPWLRDAQAESQARRNIGILFDANRLNYESESISQKLTDARLPDGRWPWFPGGQGDDFITLYIVTGFGRLHHLGADVNFPQLRQSIRSLDEWMAKKVDGIQKAPHPEEYVPDSLDCLFLYGRSFFLKKIPVAAKHQKAIRFLVEQGRKFWLKTDCRQSQGQLALALNRWGGDENIAAAQAIMKSLKERAATSEEMGMYWNDDGPTWWWYRAPIETQALMIEAFDEVMNDHDSVEACRVWLLKQKQTQNWGTTKATADAIYSLLLRGSNLLSSDTLVETKLGDVDITPAAAEAGTGFYEQRFSAPEIKPALGEIEVKKMDSGVAWGGVHWQYLEDIDKITPHVGTPLKLTKTLYLKTNTARGPVLQPVNGPLHVGDELVVRLELRSDRDMEYIHIKDQRGSGAEPVNVLSEFKYQDGLGYYESTRDTASHFFIDYLPKGSYVFEYSVRLQLRGQYQTGVAEIECMYAPEFNSHSASAAVTVQ